MVDYERKEKELMAKNKSFTELPKKRYRGTIPYENDKNWKEATLYTLRGENEWLVRKGKVSFFWYEKNPTGRLFRVDPFKPPVNVSDKEYDLVNGFVWCTGEPDEARIARLFLEKKLENREQLIKSLKNVDNQIDFLNGKAGIYNVAYATED